MRDPTPPPLILNTLTDLIDTFIDFLTVSIHAILHLRSLYPPSTFITTCKYNYDVPQQRHPDVSKWILDACRAVKSLLLEGIIRCVVFVIYQDPEVVERWIFDIDLPHDPKR